MGMPRTCITLIHLLHLRRTTGSDDLTLALPDHFDRVMPAMAASAVLQVCLTFPQLYTGETTQSQDGSGQIGFCASG